MKNLIDPRQVDQSYLESVRQALSGTQFVSGDSSVITGDLYIDGGLSVSGGMQSVEGLVFDDPNSRIGVMTGPSASFHVANESGASVFCLERSSGNVVMRLEPDYSSLELSLRSGGDFSISAPSVSFDISGEKAAEVSSDRVSFFEKLKFASGSIVDSSGVYVSGDSMLVETIDSTGHRSVHYNFVANGDTWARGGEWFFSWDNLQTGIVKSGGMFNLVGDYNVSFGMDAEFSGDFVNVFLSGWNNRGDLQNFSSNDMSCSPVTLGTPYLYFNRQSGTLIDLGTGAEQAFTGDFATSLFFTTVTGDVRQPIIGNKQWNGSGAGWNLSISDTNQISLNIGDGTTNEVLDLPHTVKPKKAYNLILNKEAGGLSEIFLSFYDSSSSKSSSSISSSSSKSSSSSLSSSVSSSSSKSSSGSSRSSSSSSKSSRSSSSSSKSSSSSRSSSKSSSSMSSSKSSSSSTCTLMLTYTYPDVDEPQTGRPFNVNNVRKRANLFGVNQNYEPIGVNLLLKGMSEEEQQITVSIYEWDSHKNKPATTYPLWFSVKNKTFDLPFRYGWEWFSLGARAGSRLQIGKVYTIVVGNRGESLGTSGLYWSGKVGDDHNHHYGAALVQTLPDQTWRVEMETPHYLFQIFADCRLSSMSSSVSSLSSKSSSRSSSSSKSSSSMSSSSKSSSSSLSSSMSSQSSQSSSSPSA